MISVGSSSDEEENRDGSAKARREDLQKRLKQFRERKAGPSSKPFSRCCQLLLPEDYNIYMGLESNFVRHGFSVVKGSLREDSELPCLQWCPYRSVAWELVFRGELVCNHYHMRSGLVRKAELCDIVSAFKPQCLPETHTAILDTPSSRSAFIDLVESLSQSGVWIIKVIPPPTASVYNPL